MQRFGTPARCLTPLYLSMMSMLGVVAWSLPSVSFAQSVTSDPVLAGGTGTVSTIPGFETGTATPILTTGTLTSTSAVSVGSSASTSAVSVGSSASTSAVGVGTSASTSAVSVGTSASTTAVSVGSSASTSAVGVGTSASTTAVSVGTSTSTTAAGVGASTSTTAAAPVQFSYVVTKTNARNVGEALREIDLAGGTTLTNMLSTVTEKDAQDALRGMSGDEAVAFGQIAERRLDQAQSMVSARLDSTRGADATTSTSAEVSSPAKQDIWVQASYQNARTGGNGDTGAAAYIDRSAALAMGHDRVISPSIRVGAALMLNDDTVSFDQRSANGRVDGAQALMYGAFTPIGSPLYVNTIASYGWWENTLGRQVTLGTVSGNARGSFATTGESLYAETGIKLPTRVGLVTPYVGAKIGRYQQQSYAESATNGSDAFDLQYGKNHTTAASTVLGVRLAQGGATLFGHRFDWQMDVSWQHRFGAQQSTLNAAFEDAPAERYQLSGNKMDRDALRSTISVNWALDQRTSIYADIGASLGASTKAYGGNAGVVWKW